MTEIIRYTFECRMYGIDCDAKKKKRCRCSVDGDTLKEAKTRARNIMKEECQHATPLMVGWIRTGVFQPELFDGDSPSISDDPGRNQYAQTNYGPAHQDFA